MPLLLAPEADAAKKKSAAKTLESGVSLPVYAASTATLTVDLIAARFAELDRKMDSLRANFRQSVRLEGSDTVQTVEGEVLFKKPDFLRMTLRIPEPQAVVSDGTWLWVHRESTNQVIKTALDQWRRSEPLAKGLLDFGRSADMLERYHTVLSTVSAPDSDGHRRFELLLTPKPAADKSANADFRLILKSSTRDFFPAEAVLAAGRATIRSLFQDVRLNPTFSDGAFRFAVPPGADLFLTPPSTP